VFKDELGKLLPHDDDAQRLCERVFHYAEFFQEFGIEPPQLERKAFVWGHCHHKATGGIDSELELLRRMGVETETIKAGCCGLAGSWGFEAEHFDVSTKAGEHGLLPKVRQLDSTTIVVADGFSCKTQIEQSDGGRRALHVAQVLKMAGEHGAQGPPGAWPERLYYEKRPEAHGRTKAVRLGACAVAAAGLAGVISWVSKSSRKP
jgi:Fe-S oxidoreductase